MEKLSLHPYIHFQVPDKFLSLETIHILGTDKNGLAKEIVIFDREKEERDFIFLQDTLQQKQKVCLSLRRPSQGDVLGIYCLGNLDSNAEVSLLQIKIYTYAFLFGWMSRRK